MDPKKLRKLADWLDRVDVLLGGDTQVVQTDLRQWANELEEAEMLRDRAKLIAAAETVRIIDPAYTEVVDFSPAFHEALHNAPVDDENDYPTPQQSLSEQGLWCFECALPYGVGDCKHDKPVKPLLIPERGCWRCTCLEIDATGTCMRCGAKVRQNRLTRFPVSE